MAEDRTALHAVNREQTHIGVGDLPSTSPDPGKRLEHGYVRQKPPSNENGGGCCSAGLAASGTEQAALRQHWGYVLDAQNLYTEEG